MKNKRNGAAQSLCGYCGKACNAGCSWSDVFDPVEGWEAVRTLNSYFVIDCPEYISDARHRRDAENMDTEGCIQLMEAVIGMMHDDYISLSETRKPIERFIRNPHVKHLFFFAPPDEIINQLRKEADEHDRAAKR